MPHTGVNFLQALGWAVLNSLWQMAFIWAVYQCILAVRNMSAAARTSFSTTAVIAGFAWFLYTLFTAWFSNDTPVLLQIILSNTSHNRWNELLQFALPYASVMYLLLLIIPVSKFIRNYRVVMFLRKHGITRPNALTRLFVEKHAAVLGIKQTVKVFLSSFVKSPVTIGFFKPIILLPVAIINQLNTKQVEAILLHELAHIRRHDFLFNLIINTIRTILYFNPFLKLFIKDIEREREKNCDEMVMQFQYDSHQYASALLALEQNNYQQREVMALAAAGKSKDLLHRIENIVGVAQAPLIDKKRITGIVTAVLAVIVINALLFFSTAPAISNENNTVLQEYNPLYHLLNDGYKPTEAPVIKTKPAVVNKNETAVVHSSNHTIKKYTTAADENFEPAEPVDNPGFLTVNITQPVIPVLDAAAEATVEDAVNNTKRVIQEIKWKEIERKAADALTRAEKEKIKVAYDNQVAKMNWDLLADKLRLSYENINWNKVNMKLDNEIARIRIDSLINVYSYSVAQINDALKWMKENNTSYIPDTKLQLQEIVKQKQQLQKQLDEMKAVRKKKIITL